jgi:hypothetical protein
LALSDIKFPWVVKAALLLHYPGTEPRDYDARALGDLASLPLLMNAPCPHCEEISTRDCLGATGKC